MYVFGCTMTPRAVYGSVQHTTPFLLKATACSNEYIHSDPGYLQAVTYIRNSRKRYAEVARDTLKTGARMLCRVFR